MPIDDPAEPRRVAAVVPGLLGGHLDGLAADVDVALSAAVERCADALLDWYDLLVLPAGGVRVPSGTMAAAGHRGDDEDDGDDGDDVEWPDVKVRRAAARERASSGGPLPDHASGQSLCHELDRARRAVAAVAAGADLSGPAADLGDALTHHLDRLADAVAALVSVARDAVPELRRQLGLPEDSQDRAAIGRAVARLDSAEYGLGGVAATTLRA